MNLPPVGDDRPQVDFSCLDKYAGFFRGEAPRNLPHIGQAAIDAFQLWKQRNYDEFRRSLEAQFVNVDLDTANQRYKELVRRHDIIETTRFQRLWQKVYPEQHYSAENASKIINKIRDDSLFSREPYVADFFENIQSLLAPGGINVNSNPRNGLPDDETVRDYLKCVMSIIRQLRPEIENVALDEPMVGEIPVGGKYKKHVRTLRRNKGRRRSLKKKKKNKK